MNKIVNGVANDYEYDFLDNIARDYIEKHTTHIKGYTEEYVSRLNKEIDRLNNVINELEKWLINEVEKLHNISGDNFTTVGQEVYQEVLDKLKELKENNNE